MKKNPIRILAAILCVFLLFSGCGKTAAVTHTPGIDAVLEKDGDTLENFEPFLRIDNDSPDAWQMELENLRIFSEGLYEFGEAKEKYNLDTTYPVSREGLDTLNVSASAQFSEKQFRELAETLREVAGDKEIIIVDLREEPHYFLNGISISWFSLHNWANLGVAHEDVEPAEDELFKALIGKTVTAYVEDDEMKQDEEITMTVETAVSEKELVESEGFTYYRLPVTDHTFPSADEIDVFIEYLRGFDPENTWLHFHCHAGKGRTGVYVTLTDKIRNPELPMQDILYRHAMTDSNYPIYYGDDDSYKNPLYAEKAELTPLLFRYIDENHESGFSITFSEWLENNKD